MMPSLHTSSFWKLMFMKVDDTDDIIVTSCNSLWLLTHQKWGSCVIMWLIPLHNGFPTFWEFLAFLRLSRNSKLFPAEKLVYAQATWDCLENSLEFPTVPSWKICVCLSNLRRLGDSQGFSNLPSCEVCCMAHKLRKLGNSQEFPTLWKHRMTAKAKQAENSCEFLGLLNHCWVSSI